MEDSKAKRRVAGEESNIRIFLWFDLSAVRERMVWACPVCPWFQGGSRAKMRSALSGTLMRWLAPGNPGPASDDSSNKSSVGGSGSL